MSERSPSCNFTSFFFSSMHHLDYSFTLVRNYWKNITFFLVNCCNKMKMKRIRMVDCFLSCAMNYALQLEFTNFIYQLTNPLYSSVFFFWWESLASKQKSIVKIFHLEIFDRTSFWLILRLEINWIFEFNEFPLKEKKKEI